MEEDVLGDWNYLLYDLDGSLELVTSILQGTGGIPTTIFTA